MAKPLNEVIDRLKSFTAAWRATAPNEQFARMTLAEFEAANEAPLRLRREIESLTVELIGKKAKRDDADRATRASLLMLADSIKGTPGYGPNSPLYGALGYIRYSEKKSGLVRKIKTPPTNITEV
jgi:hypothetical protein